MFYAISVGSSGVITAHYEGTEKLPAPWIEISAEQCVGIVAGSTWDGSNVVAPPAPTAAALLAQAQASQIQILSAACQAEILAGFTSSALGSAYTYPAKPTDQQNLSASVLASLMPGLASTWTTPFWCADASGVWAMRAHTAAQIQQVGIDGKAATVAAIEKNATLAGQVQAATTVAAVQAIVW